MNDRATKVAEDISLVQADIVEMNQKVSEIPRPEDCANRNDYESFDDMWPQPEYNLFTKVRIDVIGSHWTGKPQTCIANLL